VLHNENDGIDLHLGVPGVHPGLEYPFESLSRVGHLDHRVPDPVALQPVAVDLVDIVDNFHPGVVNRLWVPQALDGTVDQDTSVLDYSTARELVAPVRAAEIDHITL